MKNTMNYINAIQKRLVGRKLQILMLCCGSTLLISCSTYSSKFGCADSRGLPCSMLRVVDKQIDSGEIDKVYKDKCRGKKCLKEEVDEEFIMPKQEPVRAVQSSVSEYTDGIIIDKEIGS